MKTNMLAYLKIFGLSLLLTGAFMWLRGGYITVIGLTGFALSTLFYAVTMFLLTIFVLKKFGDAVPVWGILTSLVLGTLILDAYAFAKTFEAQYAVRVLAWITEPAMRLIAIGAGFAFYGIGNKIGKATVACATMLLASWFSYSGSEKLDRWLTPAFEATYIEEGNKNVEQAEGNRPYDFAAEAESE